MMSNIVPFSFENQSVRVIDKHGEPWFLAADICRALDHSDVSVSVGRLDDDEKLAQTLFVSGQNRSVWLINESGLYSLILTSRKPQAKQFKKWITSVVLPSIRKNGGYIDGQEQDTDPALIMAKALKVADSVIKQTKQKLDEAQKVIEHQKPAVDFVERYTAADTGNMGFREVCKLFGVSESWMRWFFKEKTIMYRLAGNWVPYTQHLGTGRFSMKAGVADHESGKSHAYTHSKFTPKGVKWLAGLIYEHRLEHENSGTNQGGLEL